MHVGRHLSHLVVGTRPEKSKIKAAQEAEVQLVSESWMEAVLRAGSVAAVDVGLHALDKSSVPDRGIESTKRARVSERSVASSVSDSVAVESASAMELETAISAPDRGAEEHSKRCRVSKPSTTSRAFDALAVCTPTVKAETATSGADSSVEHPKRSWVSETSSVSFASLAPSTGTTATIKVERATPHFLSGPPAITSRRHGEPGTSSGTTAT
eukprot:CAMPEP_0194493036 /NCGR_PEP_ID=MMETSP0253-20130528/11375_1 /TAXON_ID=2966 /ORGANISM="Noctiluca scintillans" /LENGTH=212 /DNA_ID=CAMNT_0039333973 /DNA_START=223 /DNA_END=857 /DNA_ORIENTATION=+